jgi:hypothetical protein
MSKVKPDSRLIVRLFYEATYFLKYRNVRLCHCIQSSKSHSHF